MEKINIYVEIEKLLAFAESVHLIEKEDVIYSKNRLLSVFGLNDCEEITEKYEIEKPYDILNRMCDWACEKGIVENTFDERDLFDTKIMGEITPRPSEVIKKFSEDYKTSPVTATNNYYEFSKNTNYIRVDRVAKNMHWFADTEYGDIEITVNLSKPEKDPRDIAKAKLAPQSSYPKCLLCKENEGYAGRMNHPARQNHRVIPVTLTNEPWFLQYSPYVYYNEHCILFSGVHRPMKIDRGSFERVLEFVDIFPHYFVGSNADLPIVGGSILSHDHFQGGNHDFPMAMAKAEETFTIKGFEDVVVEKVKWPMSVIRLRGKSKEKLVDLSDKILTSWRNYSDPKCEILAFTEDTPHNTITPIARKKDNDYEIDLVLRNNRTSEEYPLGIFHPHQELHHIKKENIGLIEVMGLAVLPGRLKEEIKILSDLMLKENAIDLIKANEKVEKHTEWCKEIFAKYNDINEKNVEDIIRVEIGVAFSKVLENAGVYKQDEEGKAGYRRFIETLNK
ncbi:UDP-glucose--hexose-1-phosphate uridylyltransferase [Fusobacterium sp.]|uniref:UDP-glucose--hexose-1-phosphate uridylyltransferase n=1 Tax=Fusobacterium sp. TaxID=68766 RepID=UPI00260CAF09|nr:UDP-glucose--hexose-1-phosphate uridylyltransferase [Fusobacterium sp.]